MARARIDSSPLLATCLLAAVACGGKARPALRVQAQPDAGTPSAADAGASGMDGALPPGDEAGANEGGADGASADGSSGDPDAAGPGPDAAADGDDAGGPQELSLPPLNAGLDYQLGEAYPPASSVGILSRDRKASPAAGLYNICYVNGFQAQPDEEDFWLDEEPDLVLRDDQGNPVIDQDWDEMLLDVSTANKRTRLAAIVGGWIAQCARDGFDAVEIDNLDTYSRSGGRITQDHAVAFIRLLADRAHAEGLAIAQKNSAEIVERKAEMDTDFVVAEECNRWNECDVYTEAYGDHVLVIEYRQADFDEGCSNYPELSIVLRDLDLVGPGSNDYVFDGC